MSSIKWMISITLDLLVQQVWNIIKQYTNSLHSSKTWWINTRFSFFPLTAWTFFSASISDPTCKESSTLSLICHLISLVPLYEHIAYFSIVFWGVMSSALVHLWYISYPFSCNGINVIKHIYMLGWPNVPIPLFIIN